MTDDNPNETSHAEAFYDEHIAPELLRLGKRCEAEGIPFLAVVSLPDGLARTATQPESSPIEFVMTSMAARAHGNADSLIMGLVKLGREVGHGSVYLEMLDRKVAEGA